MAGCARSAGFRPRVGFAHNQHGGRRTNRLLAGLAHTQCGHGKGAVSKVLPVVNMAAIWRGPFGAALALPTSRDAGSVE